MGQGFTNFPIIFTVCILIVGQIVSVRPEEFSIENLGCDSCGRDCSAVCGSRQFRSCCFNYIKKRSSDSPAQAVVSNDPGAGGHEDSHTSYRRESTSEDQLLPILPIPSVMTGGKGFFPPSESLEATNHHVLFLAEVPRRSNAHQQLPSSRKFFLSSLK